jgi:hypothetical protein
LSVGAVGILQTGNAVAAPHMAVRRTVTAIGVVNALHTLPFTAAAASRAAVRVRNARHADAALGITSGLFGTDAVLVGPATSDAYISLRVTDRSIASAVGVRHALHADAALGIASALLAADAVLVGPAACDAYISLRVTDSCIPSAVGVRNALYTTSVEAYLPPLIAVLGLYALHAAVRHRVAHGAVAVSRGETGHALARFGVAVGFIRRALVVGAAGCRSCQAGPGKQVDTAVVAAIACQAAADDRGNDAD